MESPSWNPTADPHQADRERRCGRWSQRMVFVTMLLAVGAMASQGSLRSALGVVVVGAVIAMPFIRLFWLLAIWLHQRDRAFVWSGIALLIVIVVGVVAAALRGR